MNFKDNIKPEDPKKNIDNECRKKVTAATINHKKILHYFMLKLTCE